MMRGAVIIMLSTLTGCGSSDVDPVEAAAAQAWVRKEQSPLTVEPLAMWYAQGEQSSMICGQIMAPLPLRTYRSTLRYVFFTNVVREPKGGIEPHELVIAGDATGSAILDESRRIFDRTWDSSCAPFAPWSRRVAAWFGDRALGDGGSDTPVTNQFIQDRLGVDPR